MVPKPEEADDNEEVDDLAGVPFDVKDEGVRNLRQKGQPGCKVTGRRERHSHLAGERGSRSPAHIQCEHVVRLGY